MEEKHGVSENDIQNSQNKKWKLEYLIPYGIYAVGCLVAFLLFGTGLHLLLCIAGVVLALWLGRHGKRREKLPARIASVLVPMLLMIWISSFSCGYGTIGAYGCKVWYAGSFGMHVDHFPDTVPQGFELKEMGFLPSILQGDGHVYALFQTDDPETLAEWEKQASGKAILSFSGTDYAEENFSAEDVAHASAVLKERFGFQDMDPSFWYWDREGTRQHYRDHDITIYFMESNFYWNHIRTSAIVIDRTDRVIEFIGM